MNTSALPFIMTGKTARFHHACKQKETPEKKDSTTQYNAPETVVVKEKNPPIKR